MIASWILSDATLCCGACGQEIHTFGTWRTWEQAEAFAGRVLSDHSHVCGVPELTKERLDKVGQAMKRYRSASALMTFEEEMKVYNFIMANQTYLDEL